MDFEGGCDLNDKYGLDFGKLFPTNCSKILVQAKS